MIAEPAEPSEPAEPAAPAGQGFIARFTAEGELLEVLADPLGRLAGRPASGFLDLLDEGSRQKGARLLDHVQDAGSALSWELRLGGPGGTVLRVTVFAEDDQLLAVGIPVDEDVTDLDRELVQLHRELARRTAQLERANDEKNQLIGMAAHDLRNPIGAIRGFAQLLLTRAWERLDERERMVLERIERSSDHMLDLVNDLLQLSELGGGLEVLVHRSECDLSALVAQSVEVDRAVAEQKDICVELELACDELVAVVDARKLEQVLANLLSNAIKFSEPGTTVAVSVHLDADTVVVEVRDEGPGIPVDERELIFQPFARTSVRPTGDERGTGLGLAIVQRIVEGHGGRIEVETEVGVGSVFRVLLPRRPDVAIPPRQPRSGPSAPARSHPITARTPS
jgi:signal transduction histidine kinase